MINLCLDVGVLLTETDSEFEYYNCAYDCKYGYYDENQIAYKESDKKDAIKYAKEYVQNGCNMTYAVLTNQGECANGNDGEFDDGCVEDFDYHVRDIIYSVAKIDGKIVENFIKVSLKQQDKMTEDLYEKLKNAKTVLCKYCENDVCEKCINTLLIDQATEEAIEVGIIENV